MKEKNKKVSEEEALNAVKTLIKWAGDDPSREGLLETPKRVINAYKEFFVGYEQDPQKVLSKTFQEVQNYDEMVLLKEIPFESHCEHHMVPIIGKASIAYIPNKRVVGISKLARLLEIYAKRLQTQETMTAQIADAIERYLEPRGVAVILEAVHQCITTRGIHKENTVTVTSQMRGLFKTDSQLKSDFLLTVYRS